MSATCRIWQFCVRAILLRSLHSLAMTFCHYSPILISPTTAHNGYVRAKGIMETQRCGQLT